jgi:hypothetical protein
VQKIAKTHACLRRFCSLKEGKMVVKKEENPFGKRLQYYRNCTRKPNGRPLSQSDLADEMSKLPDTIITRDQIYKWESGKSRFSPKSRADLKKIVKILVAFKGIETISQANELFAFAGLRNPEENEIRYIGLPDISAQLIQQVLPLSEETPLSPLPTENESPHPKIKVTATPIRAGSGGHLPFDPINNTVVDVFYNRTPSFKGIANAVHENRPGYEADLPIPSARKGLAPHRPEIFIGREQDIQDVKEHLHLGESILVPHEQALIILRGWPGVGKTTLATALAYDEEIMQRFPDGVLFISLGQKPDLLKGLIAWGEALDIPHFSRIQSIPEASWRLTTHLQSSRVFLIIDDAWNPAHVEPFKVGGTDCGTIITTRSLKTATGISPLSEQIYALDVLSPLASLKLMQKIAPQVTAEHPQEIQDLVEKVGRLPLALQVAGRLLEAEHAMGFGVTDLIAEIQEGQRLLEEKAMVGQNLLAEETSPTVAALLIKSLNHLDKSVCDRYAYLGTCAPSPARFDLQFLKDTWQMDDPKPVIKALVDRGLLEYVPDQQVFQMHALLVMLAKSLWQQEN